MEILTQYSTVYKKVQELFFNELRNSNIDCKLSLSFDTNTLELTLLHKEDKYSCVQARGFSEKLFSLINDSLKQVDFELGDINVDNVHNVMYYTVDIRYLQDILEEDISSVSVLDVISDDIFLKDEDLIEGDLSDFDRHCSEFKVKQDSIIYAEDELKLMECLNFDLEQKSEDLIMNEDLGLEQEDEELVEF